MPRPAELKHDIVAAETAVERFWREMGEGLAFLRDHPRVVFLGTSWALFLGAMMTGVVVTPPLSDHVFHAGATGLRMAERRLGSRRIPERAVRSVVIARLGSRGSIAISMALLTVAMTLSPFSPWLALAVLLYGIMGSARGLSGVAMNTSLMEQVPQHFMGRVQNTFYFFGTVLQIVLAWQSAGRLAREPGRRLRRDRRRLRGCIRQRIVADQGSSKPMTFDRRLSLSMTRKDREHAAVST